jgi:hypothetical protein
VLAAQNPMREKACHARLSRWAIDLIDALAIYINIAHPRAL